MSTIKRASNVYANLCDSCVWNYPACYEVDPVIEFGQGVGEDNVTGCNIYDPVHEEQFEIIEYEL